MIGRVPRTLPLFAVVTIVVVVFVEENETDLNCQCLQVYPSQRVEAKAQHSNENQLVDVVRLEESAHDVVMAAGSNQQRPSCLRGSSGSSSCWRVLPPLLLC